jgi:GMP synthase PP-ATPase subunit
VNKDMLEMVNEIISTVDDDTIREAVKSSLDEHIDIISSQIEHIALVDLLVQKGIITGDEYTKAVKDTKISIISALKNADFLKELIGLEDTEENRKFIDRYQAIAIDEIDKKINKLSL